MADTEAHAAWADTHERARRAPLRAAATACALVLLSMPSCRSFDSQHSLQFPQTRMNVRAGEEGVWMGGDSKLFGSESSWQSYLKMVPPRRVSMGDSATLGGMVANRGRTTFMLDLDKTCLFGNDGNDLGLSLQWMGKSPEIVRELYTRLVSPSLRQAYESYAAKGEVDVVIYTRRPQLLNYKSCMTGEVLGLRYADWHDAAGQVHIPATMQQAGDVLEQYCGPVLDEEEEHDVLKGLERLLAARDAIALELGLATAPPVVVTATEKDLDKTARHLGLHTQRIVLYDDNVALSKDSRVVVVEPLISLPSAQRDELLRFMQQVLPVNEIDEDLIIYLEGANPAEQAIRHDPLTGHLVWWVPEERSGRGSQWRLLDAPKDAVAQASLTAQKLHLKLRLSASCANLPLVCSDGSISPVTEPASPPALDCKVLRNTSRRSEKSVELIGV